MSNEGIRLPSDSTVASQKVHRGNTLPETQVMQPTSKEAPIKQPLLTVVLQAKPILEGKKGALFDLVLQNDPKSAPPIRLQSDTRIAPGTSLILEQVAPNQFEAVKNPSQAQLTKLVQLELEFWRAHLLPKSGRRVFPALPSPPELSNLAREQPFLKPLVQWLAQKPESLTGQTVQQWFKDFAPLNSLRPWAAQTQTPTTSPPPPLAPGASVQTQPVLSGQTPNFPIIQRANNELAAPTTSQNTGIIVPDIRLLLPIGLKSPLALAVRADPPDTPLNAVSQPRTSSAPATSQLNIQGPIQFSGQVFRLSETTINPQALREAVIFTRPAVAPQNPAPSSLNVPSASPQANTYSNPNSAIAPNLPQPSNQTVRASAEISSTAPLIAVPSSNTHADVKQTPQSNVQSPLTVSADASKSFIHQPIPSVAPIRTESLGRIPAEVLLTLWQRQIDGVIQQTPSALGSDVRNKAADLLQQMSAHSQIINTNMSAQQSITSAPDNANEEPPILQLRNWLDATVARMQNNAIQVATAQWSSPEPPVQQMQLPLIWLGLTHWADVEWWQEKPRSKKSGNTEKEKQQRHWRMKLFLTLSPLAPVCADIDWSNDRTSVTFWSEDAATLQHVNNLLPTLHEWTQGLGDKELTTKHGMPKRADQKQQADASQHLVDIRT